MLLHCLSLSFRCQLLYEEFTHISLLVLDAPTTQTPRYKRYKHRHLSQALAKRGVAAVIAVAATGAATSLKPSIKAQPSRPQW